MHKLVHLTPEQRAAENEAASDVEFIAAGRSWLAGYAAGTGDEELYGYSVAAMNPREVAANLDHRYPGGLAAAREQLITASLEAERW